MNNCPYCKAPLTGSALLPPMSKRQQIIYNSVVLAGRDGIEPKVLLKRMYDHKPPPGGAVVMRVQIHAINGLLKPHNQRIKGQRYGAYRLTEV